ncbi:PRC-barrel domain-containing protein [Streptomyces sp. DSM 42041]|uniref:PRC-barrel domain-containing protein n=1 Tax=Streptomyces hazeniae TaxID=3075538 RepID=A0ABU2NSS6_9ACTN|nr:PRC-barrel domain-containing protein [Streptomyces sp. DSM 42041]MDT0380041.1 PRC-barrel domain-containing protein [Streptomyces sp. DSM 42041]
MTALLLAGELTQRPVVTLGGEAVAQIKDTVFDRAAGAVAGFTLSGRGLFSGPKRRSLPWSGVHALGRDAVMIRDADVFESRGDVVARAESRGGDVLGARVLTDDGTDLGEVVDVVLETGAGVAKAVGYEIASTAALGRQERRVYLSLPDTLAVSGESLVVPAVAAEFVAEDLPGFAETVRAFRERLRKGAP